MIMTSEMEKNRFKLHFLSTFSVDITNEMTNTDFIRKFEIFFKFNKFLIAIYLLLTGFSNPLKMSF